jgi:hypothetical protein
MDSKKRPKLKLWTPKTPKAKALDSKRTKAKALDSKISTLKRKIDDAKKSDFMCR